MKCRENAQHGAEGLMFLPCQGLRHDVCHIVVRTHLDYSYLATLGRLTNEVISSSDVLCTPLADGVVSQFDCCLVVLEQDGSLLREQAVLQQLAQEEQFLAGEQRLNIL